MHPSFMRFLAFLIYNNMIYSECFKYFICNLICCSISCIYNNFKIWSIIFFYIIIKMFSKEIYIFI